VCLKTTGAVLQSVSEYPAFYRTVLQAFIEERFPKEEQGRPRASVQGVLDVVFFTLKSGCPWRMVPSSRNVSVATAHRWFLRWSRSGIFERAYKHIRNLYTTRFRHTRKSIITDCTLIKNAYGRDCLGRIRQTEVAREASSQ
jgi:transposase